jgi:hypothetical protein
VGSENPRKARRGNCEAQALQWPDCTVHHGILLATFQVAVFRPCLRNGHTVGQGHRKSERGVWSKGKADGGLQGHRTAVLCEEVRISSHSRGDCRCEPMKGRRFGSEGDDWNRRPKGSTKAKSQGASQKARMVAARGERSNGNEPARPSHAGDPGPAW